MRNESAADVEVFCALFLRCNHHDVGNGDARRERRIRIVPDGRDVDQLYGHSFGRTARRPRGRGYRYRVQFARKTQRANQNLCRTPRRKSFIAQNKFLRRSRKTRIVFDSREASGRGEWTNADAVAAEVRAKLDPDAYEVAVEDDVAAMTVEEQAALYHGAAAVVAPQGSSLANVAFLRPGAMVFEITCGDASWIRGASARVGSCGSCGSCDRARAAPRPGEDSDLLLPVRAQTG